MHLSALLAVVSLLPFSFSQTVQVPLEAQGLSVEQAEAISDAGERVEFQSDISRLMRVVVSHLYNDRDVFLRELVSNAGDALEKVRVVSLTEPNVLEGAEELNITLSVVGEKGKKGGRIVLRDTGIGMTKEELTKNLGTIARSGTSEFLSKIEDGGSGAKGGNLIGQFGLGFYSSFLVADRVTVASKSPYSDKQYVFETRADANEFKIAEDPRGNTLGRGTELTLYLKDDATAYASPQKIAKLISKNSEFATTSPIYLWEEKEIEVPDPEAEVEDEKTDSEDEDEDGIQVDETPKPPKMKKEHIGEWRKLNSLAPLWMRDPKSIDNEDYKEFYKATFKDREDPVAWTHFKGDTDLTTFRALVYIPKNLPNEFFAKSYQSLSALKLFVRRVFITSDVGESFLPKWLNWIKVIVDADDLPLNVGRDSLQKSKSITQIKKNIIKKVIDLFTSLSSDDEKYIPIFLKSSVALKIGVLEEPRLRDKLVKLIRWESSGVPSGNYTSLDGYVERRKKGQKQIYYIAAAGMERKDVERSPFVEKLIARGYEVLYFTDPIDEMIVTQLRKFRTFPFQDVAKKGLKFGDEDEDEKEEVAALTEEFQPLIDYIKPVLEEFVGDILVSTHLTTSPSAILVDSYAWTGNMERLMNAQNQVKGQDDFMRQMMKTQKKTLEINPRHPLLRALLQKVKEFDYLEGTEKEEEEKAVKEILWILWDTTSVRSGFQIRDLEEYFGRVEILLRRAVGVSETSKAPVDVKPAPAVEEGPLPDDELEFLSKIKPMKNEDDEDEDDDESVVPEAVNQPPIDSSNIEWQDWKDIKDKVRKQEKEHDEL